MYVYTRVAKDKPVRTVRSIYSPFIHDRMLRIVGTELRVTKQMAKETSFHGFEAMTKRYVNGE